MSVCKSCGGDNAPGTPRCQYCGRALVEQLPIDVAWTADAQGVAGRGRVRVLAPVGAGTDRVRLVVEAAFAAAVGAAGPTVTAEQAQADMARRLPALLPSDHALAEVVVESCTAFMLVAKPVAGGARPTFAPAPAPARASSGIGCLACLPLMLGLCCVLTGGLGLLTSAFMADDIERVEKAPVMTPEQALAATGAVCIENAVATIDTNAMVASDGAQCIYLYEHTGKGPTTMGWTPAFRLGPLEVRTGARPQADAAGTYTTPGGSYSAIRAGPGITVIGAIESGVLTGTGGGLYVSTNPTKAAVLDGLRKQRSSSRTSGIMCLVVGVLALLTFVTWRKRAAAGA